jgi:hypothetical protein
MTGRMKYILAITAGLLALTMASVGQAAQGHGACDDPWLSARVVRGTADRVTFTPDADYIYGVCIGTARFHTGLITYNGNAYTPLLNPNHPGNWGCYRVDGVGYKWQTDGWHWMDGELVPGHFEPQRTVTVTRTSTECAPLTHIDVIDG